MEPEKGSSTSEFKINLVVTVVSLLIAALGQLYPDDKMPEWARVLTTFGSLLVAGASQYGYHALRNERKKDAVETAAHILASQPPNEDPREEPVTENKSTPGSGVAVALLVCTCLAFSGCTGFGLKKYDELTVKQIDQTIEFETARQSELLGILNQIDSTSIDRTSLEILHKSEVTRLKEWKAYEESKKDEE